MPSLFSALAAPVPLTILLTSGTCALQAVRGYAQVLMHFTAETDSDAITAYLTTPGGKMGAGLAELAANSPIIGRLFGASKAGWPVVFHVMRLYAAHRLSSQGRT